MPRAPRQGPHFRAPRVARRAFARCAAPATNGSITVPPPIVRMADWSRSMKRSPFSARERLVGDHLHECGGARRDRGAAPDCDARGHVGGPQMQMHGRPVLERLGFAREQVQAHVEALRRRMNGRRDDPVAAVDVRDVGAGDVQCAALARDGPRGGLPVFLDAAHANLDAAAARASICRRSRRRR